MVSQGSILQLILLHIFINDISSGNDDTKLSCAIDAAEGMDAPHPKGPGQA